MHVAFLILALAGTPQPPDTQKPVGIGGAIEAPKKTKHVAPEYPEDARKAALEGVVILEAIVDTTGRISSVDVLDGPVPLRKAAVKAVEKWRYTPTKLEGQPVPVIMTVTVNFKHSHRVALDELIQSLRHKDEYIREAAARTLGRLGPQARDAVPALQTAMTDESERVRKAAADAFDAIRGK